jgi:hypothetical protein
MSIVNSIIWNNPTSLHLYIHLAVSLQYSGYTIFFDNAQNFLYYIVVQFWLSTILIITSEWCHQKLTYETKVSTNRFCLPIRHQQIFSCFAIGTRVALKVPLLYKNNTWDKNWLNISICEIVITLYMSKYSFKYYCCLFIIWFCTAFSGKLATMATGHATQSLKTRIAWPVCFC